MSLRLRRPGISCALVALCTALSLGACGKSFKKSPQETRKKQASGYINELARIHKGVLNAINKYRSVTRPSPHIPEKLKSARVELSKSLTRWEKELAAVKAPFADANELHAAYLEYMNHYLGFMRAGLAMEAALATKKLTQPQIAAHRRKLMKAQKAWDGASLRMEKKRKRFAKKFGLELVK